MTDNEIKKALECCMNGHCDDDCPFRETREHCHNLDSLILDLINRQDTEIERLQAENERLSQFGGILLRNGSELFKEIQTAKAEAYKEFAEKMNCEAEKTWIDREGDFLFSDSDNLPLEIYDTVTEWCKDATDYILKEKVGEKNEWK